MVATRKKILINLCCGPKSRDENPGMSLPIEKRMNTELFIDERVELFNFTIQYASGGKDYFLI